MPQVGDRVPSDHVPASAEELAALVGRNTIGFGAGRMSSPGRKAAISRAKARSASRRKAHVATQGATGA